MKFCSFLKTKVDVLLETKGSAEVSETAVRDHVENSIINDYY